MGRCLLIVLILLGGCSTQEDSPLRVGTNIWPGYEPLYLAQSLGNYAQVPIRLVEYPSASEVMRAFRNQTLEAAALTLDEVLALREDGIPVTVVLVNDVSDGADVIVARQGISSMKALKGKKIALEAGALGAYMITRALEINGMTLEDIQVINKDVNMHEAALLHKEVDAAVTFEPVRTRLLNAGGNEIFNSRKIPGEIVDVLVVRNSYLKCTRSMLRLWWLVGSTRLSICRRIWQLQLG